MGAAFGPTDPYEVTEDSVREFAAAIGDSWTPGEPVPPTFPIKVTFSGMGAFLSASKIDLATILHGDQKFSYTRPLAVGDVLTTTFEVVGVRTVGSNDIISTSSAVTDASGALVCTATATLIRRGAA